MEYSWGRPNSNRLPTGRGPPRERRRVVPRWRNETLGYGLQSWQYREGNHASSIYRGPFGRFGQDNIYCTTSIPWQLNNMYDREVIPERGNPNPNARSRRHGRPIITGRPLSGEPEFGHWADYGGGEDYWPLPSHVYGPFGEHDEEDYEDYYDGWGNDEYYMNR